MDINGNKTIANISIRLNTELEDKVTSVMRTYDMSKSQAIRFMINQGYLKIFPKHNK